MAGTIVCRRYRHERAGVHTHAFESLELIDWTCRIENRRRKYDGSRQRIT
jgi:hypothetical protein